MNRLIYIFSLFAVSLMIACTDDFEEINADPNEPTVVPADNLFTQAEFSLSDLVWGRALNFEFGMLMVQHFAQNEYAEDSRYNQNNSTFSTPWARFYSGSALDGDNKGPGGIVDLNEARILTENNANLTDAERDNRLAQIAILRVWAIQNMTDIWGAIPYSQALQPEEFPNPIYDSQEEVYNGIIEELNAAIALIKTGASGFTDADVIYGGDMAMWGKFANSLKLRIGMRISDKAPAKASTLVSEALSNPMGVISSNAENANFTFGSDQRLANPFFVDQITRDDFVITEILVEELKDKNDPRLDYYAKINPAVGEIKGMPYGLTDAKAFALKQVTSRPADAIRQATAPAKLLTYAEVEFFKAEAYARNIASGTPSAAYESAIMAAMKDWGVESAAIDSYIAAHPYNNVDDIAYEKWVALYTQGLEAWAESRRMDFDTKFLVKPTAAVTPIIPVRAFYPAIEQEANAGNLANVGVNDMVTPLWWDVD